MNLEKIVSKMMTLNIQARLWHWMTDKAQHHTTFEQFLTQNETLTDSFVESALGNDFKINFKDLGVTEGKCKAYSIENSRSEIKNYRLAIAETKGNLEKSDTFGSEELVTILDDVVELTSKTLYLLSLN